MNSKSGFMGGLYIISEWIMKFSLINLFWILFNIPIVFLLLNILFVERMEELPLLLIPLIILIPILFFPATTAMFAMVREWIINDEDNGQLFRSYWGYYKDNYKKSVLSGLILTMAWLILAVDVFYLFDKNNSMMFLFLIMGIILFVFSINLFSITVHYHMRLLTSLKNAFLLTIGSPVLFMAVAISSGLVLYISVNIFRYLLPFLTGSLIAFLTFSAFYRNHLKLIEKSER
ncbi:MAG TPA: DUF624 domain-containing protein [Sporosarcina psychrophila]|uniref:DUF624 domain-containing protein n=2 Tax=Sporosarcina TaxID=1569 RepID=A0A921KF35_SPOPS|nr:DUF624 domain-containing protein [Sporosarcina psychrophila]